MGRISTSMLTIPPNQRATVQQLISLSTEELNALVKALETTPPAASMRAYVDRLESKTGISDRDLRGILHVIGVLAVIQEDDAVTSERLVEDLIAAIKTSESTDSVKSQDWDRVSRDLNRIFNASGPAAITAKAAQLVGEHQHSYCCEESRIVSDVRTIFRSGDISDPIGAVIVHMLKLAYHQGDESKEFFVALDSEDVRHLRDLIDRAIIKESFLNKFVKSSGVPLIRIEEEE
jgi:hypothetical protein